MTGINRKAILFLNQKNYILKDKRLSSVDIDEMRNISDLKYGMIQITQK